MGGNVTLMSWGPVEFEIWPLNIHEWAHETAADWAPKEVVGAATFLEWVGEEPEVISVRGRIFPYVRIGGLSGLQVLEGARHAGVCEPLMLGGSNNLGWFVILRLTREHAFLGNTGIGNVVAFEAIFQRCAAPDGASYLPSRIRLYGGQAT